MRRFVVPIALVLALATGAVLAETRLALAPVPLAPADDRTGDIGVVRDWYVAANRTIATGNASALSRLLAPGFADHSVPPEEDGAVDLLAYLTRLYSTHPGVRLVPLDLAAAGGRVVARVRVDGAEAGQFLGLPVAGAAVWGAVDVFRVERGSIAEHWGDGRPLARFTPLLTTPPLASAGGEVVALERRTYPPDAGESLTGSGFAVVLVETGELKLTLDRLADGTVRRLGSRTTEDAVSRAPIPAGTVTVLGAGEALLLEGAIAGALRNEGKSTAVALVLTATASRIGAGSGKTGTGTTGHDSGPGWTGAARATERAAPPAGGPTVETLAGGQWVALPGDATLAIGRATLPAGASVARHSVLGADLLSVEAGELALTVESSGAWVRRGADGRSTLAETAILGAGEGALVRCCEASYLGAGADPLMLLIVTIGPGGSH
jgi:predicted SnoaL-like aldol condensation-catalyzing enzyme